MSAASRAVLVALLAAAAAATAAQPARLVRVVLDRGVLMCVYRTASGAEFRQVGDMAVPCPLIIMVP